MAPSPNVIAVVREVPSDLLTPVSALLRLRAGVGAGGSPGAFLLESADGGEQVGRWTFLGVAPFAVLTLEDGTIRATRADGSVEELPGAPLQALAAWTSRYRRAPAAGLPPFAGGLVGWVGYEFARSLERLPAPERRAARHDAVLMAFRDVVAFDRLRHRAYAVSCVFLDEEDEAAGTARARGRLDAIQDALAHPPASEQAGAPLLDDGASDPEIPGLRGTLGVEGYAAGVRRIRRHILDGDVFQCVLSERFEAPLPVDPFRVYRALRSISPAPWLYYLDLPEREALLGASPELLVRVEGGTVTTSPIAGTRPRGRDLVEDAAFARNLLASVKERAEHLMLVDLGRNDLGRVSRPGSVHVREFQRVERFSHVMHLVSAVDGRLRAGVTPWDALASCFPAGTLTGAPKIRAMQVIADLEPVQRGPYGGAVACLDFSGRLDACITIRSLHVQDGVASIQAGAGIVADSRPDREWTEVRNKTRAVRRAVAAALQSDDDGAAR